MDQHYGIFQNLPESGTHKSYIYYRVKIWDSRKSIGNQPGSATSSKGRNPRITPWKSTLRFKFTNYPLYYLTNNSHQIPNQITMTEFQIQTKQTQLSSYIRNRNSLTNLSKITRLSRIKNRPYSIKILKIKIGSKSKKQNKPKSIN